MHSRRLVALQQIWKVVLFFWDAVGIKMGSQVCEKKKHCCNHPNIKRSQDDIKETIITNG